MQEEEDTRKDFSIVLIHQGQCCTSPALQVHSGRKIIDLSLQDNVIILDSFFKYICYL